MRTYAPLTADHPAARQPCVICRKILGVGAVTTLVMPTPAGAEEVAKAAAGRAHIAAAGVAHAECAKGALS